MGVFRFGECDCTMSTSFTINGRTYHSLDEMPPDVRRQYDQMMQLLADRDGNGIPDGIEHPERITTDPLIGTVSESSIIVSSTRTFQDGQEVVPADLPADVREKISQAFGAARTTPPQTTDTAPPRWTLADDRPLADDHATLRNGIWLNWPSLLLLLAAVAVLAGAAVWVVLQKQAP